MVALTARQVLLGLGAVILLTFLFVKTQTVDQERHDQIIESLRQLKHLEATLNEDILRAKDGVLNNYDSLVAIVNRLRETTGGLGEGSRALSAIGQPDIDRRFHAYVEVLNKRISAVERFKSANAVLKNSLMYFPVGATELSARARKHGEEIALATALDEILYGILYYHATGEAELESQLRSQIVDVTRASAASLSKLGSEFDILGGHAIIILQYTKKLSQLVQELLSMPSERLIDELYGSYTQYYNVQQQKSNVYRILLYAFAVLLSGCVVFIMIKLRRAAIALSRANEGLIDRTTELVDVNAELQTEIAERKEAEAALREREARLRHAQRMAMLGHWEWRSESDELQLSPEAASILGVPPEMLPISFAEYARLTHPDDVSSYDAIVGKAIEDRAEYEAEYRFVRPDDEVRFIHELSEPLYDAGGEPIGIQGTIQDVTEQKLTQAQLIQSSKLATLGEMATALAHELNQPLNIIRMAADSTIERIEEGAADAQYLGVKMARISAQTERAAKIIGHMRIFGRKADETPKALDLRDVVTDTMSLIGQQLRLSDIAVERILPERCREVVGHAVQLEQVLLNLITNARQAIEAAGRAPGDRRKISRSAFGDRRRNSRLAPGDRREISLIVEDEGREDKVTLTVKDTGGGIPEAAMSRIFEPFFTTKEVGQGTGLGLSVSYGIITDMGGTIDAANARGGAVFTITLPAVADRRAADLQ